MTTRWKLSSALAATSMLFAIGAVAQQTSNPNGNMSPQTSAASTAKSESSGKTHAKTDKSSDMKFAREAALGGMEEVELGRLAVKNAQSDQVKQFGQRMIDDHTKAGEQLKSVAAKNNITLPTELDAKHKASVDRFARLSGSAFDRAYMRDMVRDHEKDIADFQKEASAGSNMDLKNFASSTLPTLQDHLRQAKEASSSIGAVSSK
jgi:putative membrane protein